MLTNTEFQMFLNRMQDMVSPLEERIEELTKKVEELQNASKERPKTNTGGRKRVQQAKEDS